MVDVAHMGHVGMKFLDHLAQFLPCLVRVDHVGRTPGLAYGARSGDLEVDGGNKVLQSGVPETRVQVVGSERQACAQNSSQQYSDQAEDPSRPCTAGTRGSLGDGDVQNSSLIQPVLDPFASSRLLTYSRYFCSAASVSSKSPCWRALPAEPLRDFPILRHLDPCRLPVGFEGS